MSLATETGLVNDLEKQCDVDRNLKRGTSNNSHVEKGLCHWLGTNVCILQNHLDGWTLLLLIFFCLLASGIIYGMVHEKWNFPKSLLFTVAALSTGGLEAPSTDDTAMWFTGFFVLIGVPVYGYVLASAAGFIESWTQEGLKKEAIHHGFRAADRHVLEQLHTMDSQCADDGLDWQQFLELYLIKLDLVSMHDLVMIRQKFDEMNVTGNNRVSVLEMNVETTFATLDTNDNGYLDFDEFVALCLQLVAHNRDTAFLEKHMRREEDLRALYHKYCDMDGEGITRIMLLEMLREVELQHFETSSGIHRAVSSMSKEHQRADALLDACVEAEHAHDNETSLIKRLSKKVGRISQSLSHRGHSSHSVQVLNASSLPTSPQRASTASQSSLV